MKGLVSTIDDRPQVQAKRGNKFRRKAAKNRRALYRALRFILSTMLRIFSVKSYFVVCEIDNSVQGRTCFDGVSQVIILTIS